MEITGIDHIEFYVSNLQEAARSLCNDFGFQKVAESGPETGVEGRRSYLLTHGNIQFVLTMALHPTDEASMYVETHGDGIKDIALRTPDATEAFREAVRCQATPLREPTTFEDATGRVIRATVASPLGDVVHSFIQRDPPDSPFWPQRFRRVEPQPEAPAGLLVEVDHAAMCVTAGSLGAVVTYYERVMGFHQSHEENVETRYSGMNSRVVQNASRRLSFALMEPMPGKAPGQIDSFLAGHRGSGVQHVAMRTDDMIGMSRFLAERNVALLASPPGYYTRLAERVGGLRLQEDLEQLRNGNVLVDGDADGYLLQVFTRSVHPRRTLFYEIIRRKAARGFGTANIRALYEAVERDLGQS